MGLIIRLFKLVFSTQVSPSTPREEPVIAQPLPAYCIAEVYCVLDGDTVIVTYLGMNYSIRLDAIDCPENGQPWGDIAKAGLIKLIGGRKVILETHGIDVYERTLATLYVKQGKKRLNVNERMVTLGHAWVMRRFYKHLPAKRQHILNRLENWARSKKVGLWKQENPIPPWEWRKGESA